MSSFQKTREQTEQKVIVQLLSEIERNPSFTQRSLAGELNIALGLMNQYIKQCIVKGWVRVSQISPKRITYFLTPEGFREKSLMVKEYLERSFTFFRDARMQCDDAFLCLKAKGWNHIALVGEGDLADIANLVAKDMELRLETIKDSQCSLNHFDALLITDVQHPQATFDRVKKTLLNENPSFDLKRIVTLSLLHISREAS